MQENKRQRDFSALKDRIRRFGSRPTDWLTDPARAAAVPARSTRKRKREKKGGRWTEGGGSEMMAADAEETGGRTEPCAPPGISLRRRSSDRRWRLRSVYLQCCEYRRARAMTETRTRCCCCSQRPEPTVRTCQKEWSSLHQRLRANLSPAWSCTSTQTGTSAENHLHKYKRTSTGLESHTETHKWSSPLPLFLRLDTLKIISDDDATVSRTDVGWLEFFGSLSDPHSLNEFLK